MKNFGTAAFRHRPLHFSPARLRSDCERSLLLTCLRSCRETALSRPHRLPQLQRCPSMNWRGFAQSESSSDEKPTCHLLRVDSSRLSRRWLRTWPSRADVSWWPQADLDRVRGDVRSLGKADIMPPSCHFRS